MEGGQTLGGNDNILFPDGFLNIEARSGWGGLVICFRNYQIYLIKSSTASVALPPSTQTVASLAYTSRRDKGMA